MEEKREGERLRGRYGKEKRVVERDGSRKKEAKR